MKKKDKGFTLIEAVSALSLLILIVLFLLPIYPHIMKENKSISQERFAHYLLEKEAFLIQHNIQSSTGITGDYNFHVKRVQEGVKICISWEGENQREYEKCLFVLLEDGGDDTF